MSALVLAFTHLPALALLVWIARADVGDFSREDRDL